MSGHFPTPKVDNSYLEVLDKVRARQQKNVIQAAKDMQQAVGAAITSIANTVSTGRGSIAGSRAVAGMGPLKDEAGAAKKVRDDYASDWYSIKDVVRGTIAVDTEEQADTAFKAVKSYFVASNGWGILETKEPRRPPRGYTDWKIVVTRQGSPAEIQVNTKNMLLAKDLPFLQINCMDEWLRLKTKYHMVPVGLGHGLYEVVRTNPGTPVAALYGDVAVAYYAYFRGFNSVKELGDAATAALARVPANPSTWPIRKIN